MKRGAEKQLTNNDTMEEENEEVGAASFRECDERVLMVPCSLAMDSRQQMPRHWPKDREF